MTNKQTRSGKSQLNFLDEIIVDNFAGGGGASTGMELATGRPVAIAIIDRDYLGNEYGKTKQVARCGNAVCPPMAMALVRANLPEWCSRTITTMEELEKAVTA